MVHLCVLSGVGVGYSLLPPALLRRLPVDGRLRGIRFPP
ncbi:hypothetical protein RR42_m1634 [Cupriavidus basilensis]|uniref:Uncharacterized protein n=1 Tax=Cupriavidus basilensis TaxID=68895 RepID=A0A0C4YE27_9BURK|nr:hypothetical protein RR42_m1634 [Cupriavidus basilensis]